MRKKLQGEILIMGTLLVLLFAGCRKHTCECNAYSASNPEASGSSEFTVKGSKNKARNKCENYSTATDQYGNHTDCELQ